MTKQRKTDTTAKEAILYNKPVDSAIGAHIKFFNTATGRWNGGYVIGLFRSTVWIVNKKGRLVKIQRGFVKLEADQ